MKWFKKFIVLFLSLLMVSPCLAPIRMTAASPSMKLYAIQLEKQDDKEDDDYKEEEYGDAVLLESNGSYLLMDTGAIYTFDSVVDYLKSVGVKHLDVYISHLHSDHIGGLRAVADNFTIDKLYLPDYKTIGVDYQNASGYDIETITNSVITKRAGMDGLDDKRVVYLKKGSKFTVGNVSAEVLGPVGSYRQSQFSGNTAKKNSHYLNNYSLTTMFSCSGVKFLTTGDIEKEEETALINSYKASGKMKADILKMPHHGLTTTSNTANFYAAVSPKYFFAMNMGYENTETSNGKIVPKNYTAIERAQKYGLPYMVGTEGKPLIIDIASNKINLYRDANIDGKNTSGELLKGWVSVCGISQTSSGAYTGKDKYYINGSGNILKGVQKIDGKYYYLGEGGAMEKGYYKLEKGKYLYSGYRYYGKRLRYYNSNGSMAVGFTEIKSDNGTKYLYYFDNNGFRKNGNSNWDIIKISGKYYAMNANGVIFTNNGKGGLKTYKVKGKKYYRHFSSKGVMTTGWKTLNGSKYYFNKSTGYRETGFKEISGKYYYFNSSGKMQKNKKVTIGKVKCKFGKNGAMTSPKVSKPKSFKVKAKSKKKNVVSWKTVKNASGYIVYRSTSKNGTYKTVKTIKKQKTKSYTDKSVKSKKKYYYKVCAYKTIGGIKVKGTKTSAKSVKTK